MFTKPQDGRRNGRRIVSVDRAASASATRVAARSSSGGQKMRSGARKVAHSVVDVLTRQPNVRSSLQRIGSIDCESTQPPSRAAGSIPGSGLDFAVDPPAVVAHVGSLLHGAFEDAMDGSKARAFDSLPAAEREAMLQRTRDLLRVARRTQARVPSITSELKVYPTINPSGVVPALLEQLAATFHNGWLAQMQQAIDDNVLAVMASGDVDAMELLVSRLPPALKQPYATLADAARAVPRAVAAALAGHLRDVAIDDEIAAAEGALIASIRSRRTTSVDEATALVAQIAAPAGGTTARSRSAAAGAFFAAPISVVGAADETSATSATSHVLLAAERMMAQAEYDAIREQQRCAPRGGGKGRRGKRALTRSASKISLAVRDAADKSKSRWAALRMQTRGAATDVSRRAKTGEAAAAAAHLQHATIEARAEVLFDAHGAARGMMDDPPSAMAGWLLKCDFKRKEQEIRPICGAVAAPKSPSASGGAASSTMLSSTPGGRVQNRGEPHGRQRRSVSMRLPSMLRTKGLIHSSSMHILKLAKKGKDAFAARWFVLPDASSRTKHRTTLRYWASEQRARSALGAIDLDNVVCVEISTVADAPPNAIDLVTATRRYTLALPAHFSDNHGKLRDARFEMCRWAAALAARAQCPVGARLEMAWKVVAGSFPPALRVRGAALQAPRSARRGDTGDATREHTPRVGRRLVAARPFSIAIAIAEGDHLLASSPSCSSPLLSSIGAAHPHSPVAVVLAREAENNVWRDAPSRTVRVVDL